MNKGFFIDSYRKHPELFREYDTFIKNTLAEVFPENHRYENGLSAVYDIEKPGWSVLNKLNTNMLCLSIMVDGVNKVLRHQGDDEILFTEKTLNDGLEKLMGQISINKHRIFDRNSRIFGELMSVLDRSTGKGNTVESTTIRKMMDKFGTDNVSKISGEGNKKDMWDGVDVELKMNGGILSGQIKPIFDIVSDEKKFIVTPSSTVKKYRTNLLIFEKNEKVYIFNNRGVGIVDGKYEIPRNSMLYEL